MAKIWYQKNRSSISRSWIDWEQLLHLSHLIARSQILPQQVMDGT